MIRKITRAYTRHYSDNGQTTTYVEWLDHQNKTGRTESDASNPHMTSLLARAKREGVPHERERW